MKIKSKKEDKMTKITNKELGGFIKSLSDKYCPECINDTDCAFNDCMVMQTKSLLWEHLKEECKEQLKRRPISHSCEGCIHEHECSLTE